MKCNLAMNKLDIVSIYIPHTLDLTSRIHLKNHLKQLKKFELWRSGKEPNALWGSFPVSQPPGQISKKGSKSSKIVYTAICLQKML